ncbi:unnamed protein product [Durusdinium trenchii]|uniref:Alkyl hydroperoxide reductase subunit C/ Thiol specific antioxidant domain-containing protein n=1 Tax=Durusdinium trenchii TaxID=1381693 RepID=A0ABP0LBG5_9DINO
MACLRCARVKTLNQSVQTDPFPAKPEAPRPSEPEVRREKSTVTWADSEGSSGTIEEGKGEEEGAERREGFQWTPTFTSDFRIGLGERFPDFLCKMTSERTAGGVNEVKFHDLLKRETCKWTVLLSFTKEYLPRKGAELVVGGQDSEREDRVKKVRSFRDEIRKLFQQKGGVQLIGLHLGELDEKLAKDLDCDLIADEDGEVASHLKILDPLAALSERRRPGYWRQSSMREQRLGRAVFLIGPKQRTYLSMLYPASLSLMFDEVKKAIASVIRNEEKDQVSLPNDWSAQPNFQIVLGARLPDFEWHMTKHKIVKFHELLDQTKADLTLMMFWPETPKEQELLECLEMLPKLKKCEAGKVRVIGVTYGDMKEFQTQVETVRSKLSDEIRDFGFTVIGDTNQHIAGKLGFCGPEEDLEEFTQSKLARTLFVIDRNKALRLSCLTGSFLCGFASEQGRPIRWPDTDDDSDPLELYSDMREREREKKKNNEPTR